MVRRRIEIKPIEDKAKRHTTFTKRRQGLMKKAKAFATDFEAEAAVITFSKAGNLFGLGHPSVDSLLDRYLAEPSSQLATETAINGVDGGIEEAEGTEEAAPPSLTEAEKRIGEGVESGRWDLAVGDLGLEELGEVAAEVEKIKRTVVARAAEIAAAEGKNSPGEFSGAGSTVHYVTSLSNVDWLHGGAESLLMLTNLFIVLGLREALRKLKMNQEKH
ncbi:hypothetical protein DH2020_049236 [Rehmannia glutinosa]|uniref:MADS-box domain-containing protein n=1 Tax=Rehmannia glutinosa TaxID=99300 RepID=A0ABR0U3B6_REHGL